MADILLITPPFTQLNTPYPATAYIKGFLNTKGISSNQMDLGIEVILKLFTANNLNNLFNQAGAQRTTFSENAQRIIALRNKYCQLVEPVMHFLQGKNPTFARQICTDKFLPKAARFEQLDDLAFAFGNMGLQDRGKHLATLFLEDLSDFIVECIDPHFGFSRYAERLGRSANSFDELAIALAGPITPIDTLTLAILESRLASTQPKLICFSVPFPGNLYSAFRCAQWIKSHFPEIKTAMGGGFPNTELRSVTDKRVFDYFDFITLDDGELPLELVHEVVLSNSIENKPFKRTFICENGEVKYINNSTRSDYKQAEVGTPDYSDLLLKEYISVIEIANPMHSLWSDGRWNKLTMAHGCYWGKCTFCDISLDYIALYEPLAAKIIVDRMETLVEQTGENGFHFVDEAAPPALMKAVALEILNRNLVVTWWTNIRFEKNFTQDLCYLLKESGCIAVSGGLEVASDRLLKLIDKGVTVAQVAQVTRNFTEANIMVHAYLMYGYPTQTVQETVDSLEMVRQLFELGIVQSGFWHQFALTAHSPVGLNPDAYNISPVLEPITFANNDVQFQDNTGIDHEVFSFGLKKSLFNYMHGIGFEMPLQSWFETKIPRTTISPNYLEKCLEEQLDFQLKPNAKVVWIGSISSVERFTKSKRGNTWEQLLITVETNSERVQLSMNELEGTWLVNQLKEMTPSAIKLPTISTLKSDFESQFENFELFWFSKSMIQLRKLGLLAV